MAKSRKSSLLALGALILTFATTTALVPVSGSQILKTVPSVYNGELTVLEDSAHATRYLLAKSRQALVLQSIIELNHKQELSMGYFQVMALLTALQSDPERVFNMGLGGGALPRFHLAKYPKSTIVSAEIDAAVIDLAKKFFFVEDPRHQLVEGDGFETLKIQPGKFDVVWVDTITPKEGPKAYVQAKYLNVLRDHLSEHGVIVANLGESKNPETFRGVERGYRQGYTHGIRVKSPLPLRDETSDAVLKLVKAGADEHSPEISPSFFVAVGNSDSLTCAAFLKLYDQWKNTKTVSLTWKASDTADKVCQDLNAT